jgi:hypothetical protein
MPAADPPHRLAGARQSSASAALRPYRHAGEDQCMTMLYCRPARPTRLSAEPQLASWDRAGSTGQVKPGHFLDHAEAVAAPMMAAADGPLAVELTVGFPDKLSLTGGGRDLDNYLFPLAQRLGPARIAAMFGRKVHGPSFLAVGQAKSDRVVSPPQFSAQIAGSYARKEWKTTLREQILQTQDSGPGAGPNDFQ